MTNASPTLNNQLFDYLVIGSGIAGLSFALEAAKNSTVAIITKKELMESNSNYAQGGIAAVLDAHDSFARHVRDTLVAGCFLNDKKAVEIMVRQAPERIAYLISCGVGFSRKEGRICQTQEGGHTKRRIAFAKDATGREIERALIDNVRRHDRISVFESHVACDLIMQNKTCIGATALATEQKKMRAFFATAVVLATGGLGRVFKRNSNPKIATGDGMAMAARVGAGLRDMEFVQFHPTALAKKRKPTFLISETIRGEGGVLKNAQGKEFMKAIHAQGNLAPRDIVSRAIFEELKKGPVYLDIRHKGSAYIKKRFPYIYNQLWWHGIKMDSNLIPVAPAAHYSCGGVETDTWGKTHVPGLFAFGEVARTGVHGANRLASNSLLECVVFSHRAAKAALRYRKGKRKKKIAIKMPKVVIAKKDAITVLRNKIQLLMWNNVGIVRKEKNMERTQKKLAIIAQKIDALYAKGINRDIIELRNLVAVAQAITTAARARKKSIGAHYVVG